MIGNKNVLIKFFLASFSLSLNCLFQSCSNKSDEHSDTVSLDTTSFKVIFDETSTAAPIDSSNHPAIKALPNRSKIFRAPVSLDKTYFDSIDNSIRPAANIRPTDTLYLIFDGIVDQPFDKVHKKGDLIFAVPDTMAVWEAQTVAATIAVLGDTVAIIQKVIEDIKHGQPLISPDEITNAVHIKIPIGKFMKLKLEDAIRPLDSAFCINPDEGETLEIDSLEPTEWHWEVTPLKPGDYKLILKAYIIETDSGGKQKSKSIPAYKSDFIYVHTKTFWWIRTLIVWIVRYKFWVITSLLIPAIGAIWRYSTKQIL